MPSGIVERYLAGDARALFPSHFRERGDRQRAVQRALRPLQTSVAAAIEAQNAAYGPSSAREANLRALRSGAAAVVTGQQVGLLLGPLYTVYKAASAVAVARALAAETGAPVVPVFWLQTEDHDLAEVAECHLLRGDCEALRLALPAPDTRVSLAHVALPAETDACLARVTQELGSQPYAAEHLARLKRHYRSGTGWVSAFAAVIAELFADDGLVLVDPRTSELAAAAAPLHRRALQDAAPIAALLGERAAALRAAGFDVPVHVRPDAPLSFFHARASEGPRYRLEADGTDLREVGGEGRHRLPELLAILEAEPLRFSTSALMRPLLQDTLLPTAAYVGGPGEIAYLAQLPPLYEALGLPMPLIVPRARFVVVEPKAQRLLARHGLKPSDAQQSAVALFERCRARGSSELGASELRAQLGAQVQAAIENVLAGLPELGSEVTSAAEKTQVAIDKALDKFAQKYQSALLHRNAALDADLRKLKQLLHPLDQPQERVLGLSYFAARHGEREFLQCVAASIDPWDPTLKTLRPGSEAPG